MPWLEDANLTTNTAGGTTVAYHRPNPYYASGIAWKPWQNTNQLVVLDGNPAIGPPPDRNTQWLYEPVVGYSAFRKRFEHHECAIQPGTGRRRQPVGTHPQMWTANGTPDQQWTIQPEAAIASRVFSPAWFWTEA